MSSAVVPETPAPPPPSRPPNTFDFLRPFTFAFDDPRWVPKILLGGLFVLASFVLIGIFFVYGYLARLARNVINGVPNPLPEWDDLGDYFVEGLKLFAVGVIYTIPVALIVAVFVVPSVILGTGESEVMRKIGEISASCIWCLMFPLSLALAVWLPAAILMVIVTGEFSAGFDFSRIFGFIRANVGNYILAVVVWLVARFAAVMGLLLLCIGVIFTGFWALTVAAYAFAQTYRLSVMK